jgi:ectoine hydroxylase-related dioxygenase (phytanoyl-CoA dioxygenase family)
MVYPVNYLYNKIETKPSPSVLPICAIVVAAIKLQWIEYADFRIGEIIVEPHADVRPVVAYGIKEQTLSPSAIDIAVESLKINGFAVIESVLDENELSDFRQRLDAVYAKQIIDAGGQENLRAINDIDITRCPVGYDERFLRLLTDKTVLSVAERLLGDYFIVMLQNGVTNRRTTPNYQSGWHRDLNYQHFVSSRPLAISALYCIDNFTIETGCTHVLPGTHRFEAFPSESFIRANEKPLEAPAGSVLMMDAMVFHRSGHNRTDAPRRGVNNMFSLPFIKQQINLPRYLGDKDFDQKTKKLLGYECDTPDGVSAWRNPRIERTKGKPSL